MTNVKRKVIAKEIEEFKKYYPNLNINYQDYFEKSGNREILKKCRFYLTLRLFLI